MIAPVLRYCRACFRASFAIMLEYRATVFLWILAGLTPLIMMFVWRHLAADAPLGGRDPKAFSFYFLTAFLATQCCIAWVVWNVDYQVRNGTYAIQLLRPFDPWFAELIENVSAYVLRMPLNVLITAAGLLLSGGWELIVPGRLPAFLLALLLSWQLMFNTNYALALLCLWSERAKSADSWIYIMLYTLGGALFPLDFLSPGARAVIAWTPFPWMVNFPVELLAGGVPPFPGFAMQAAWLAVMVAFHRILWARGRKRFGAVGG
ncbi:MAG TPA: ABC-2 family transporter protein [Dongiaceae bacterium]|jgi:ABC-2 type transport system permease protein|nr:ABC-2 family transporter protein [Dongiaceae bacterium]